MADKPGGADSPLGLIGLHPGDERIYRHVLRASGSNRLELTEATGLTLAELEDVLGRFAALGLVHLSGDVVSAEPPTASLGRLIADEAERLQRASERVDALRDLLPGFLAEHLASDHGRTPSVDVQAVEGGDIVRLLRTLAQEFHGELMWFRPDQWRLPVTDAVDELVRDLVASGRRSRAIYPARVLEEAPQVVRSRADAGELVRIVATVPTRIAIIGGDVAVMTDRWGASSARRLVVREHALVGALGALFESTWERAMTVPGIGALDEDPGGLRRVLLHQLTRGAKDEQIARALGVSLRTVRRRIAEVMDDLGADSRFQAGVEAVRRGWI